MEVCYIVGASPHCARFSPREGDLVIAADGGQNALSQMGILPHLAVGDFDSSLAPSGIPTVKHPVEKDDTDTSLAIREGARRGYTTFALYGCTGGRPDHAFGAVQKAEVPQQPMIRNGDRAGEEQLHHTVLPEVLHGTAQFVLHISGRDPNRHPMEPQDCRTYGHKP